jgi:transposase
LNVNNNPKEFILFKDELERYGFEISRFLMETTGVYHFPIVWQLRDMFPESRIIAMNALTLKEYMPKVSKNDKADAVRIAQVAQLDDFIKKTYIPTKDEFALRELLRQRRKIIREYVRLKNASRKIFASAGFTYKFEFKREWEMKLIQTFLESNRTFGEAVKFHKNQHFVKRNKENYINWINFNMSKMFKANVLFLFGMMGQTKVNLEMVESALLRRINDDATLTEKLSLLKECDGLGILSAVGIILESGDITRFQSVSHYLSYCGISPREGTSGYISEDSEKEKVVSKATPNKFSNHNLKHLYIVATGSLLKKAKENVKDRFKNDMTRYSGRFVKDKRPKLKLKFKIAAKLARKVFFCLKTNQKYDPNIEYNRNLIFKGEKGIKLQKSMPKRKRQAWAYIKMQLLQKDMEGFLTKIEMWSNDDQRVAAVKRDFEQFMRKYNFPSGFEQLQTEVII